MCCCSGGISDIRSISGHPDRVVHKEERGMAILALREVMKGKLSEWFEATSLLYLPLIVNPPFLKPIWGIELEHY